MVLNFRLHVDIQAFDWKIHFAAAELLKMPCKSKPDRLSNAKRSCVPSKKLAHHSAKKSKLERLSENQKKLERIQRENNRLEEENATLEQEILELELKLGGMSVELIDSDS